MCQAVRHVLYVHYFILSPITGVMVENFNNKYGHPPIRTDTCHRKQEKLHQNACQLSMSPAPSRPGGGIIAIPALQVKNVRHTCPGTGCLWPAPGPGLTTARPHGLCAPLRERGWSDLPEDRPSASPTTYALAGSLISRLLRGRS